MFGFSNTSKFDRVLRAIFATILIVLGFLYGAAALLGIVAIVTGIAVMVTVFTGLCPIYKVFGICTNAPNTSGFSKVGKF